MSLNFSNNVIQQPSKIPPKIILDTEEDLISQMKIQKQQGIRAVQVVRKKNLQNILTPNNKSVKNKQNELLKQQMKQHQIQHDYTELVNSLRAKSNVSLQKKIKEESDKSNEILKYVEQMPSPINQDKITQLGLSTQLKDLKDLTKSSQSLIALRHCQRTNEYAKIQKRELDLNNYKIKKDAFTLPQIKNVLCYYVSNNRKYFNKEVIKIPSYEKSAPFFVDTLKFADHVLPGSKIVVKNFGFDEENLYRNKLILEKVFLERILKEESNRIKDQMIQIGNSNQSQSRYSSHN